MKTKYFLELNSNSAKSLESNFSTYFRAYKIDYPLVNLIMRAWISLREAGLFR